MVTIDADLQVLSLHDGSRDGRSLYDCPGSMSSAFPFPPQCVQSRGSISNRSMAFQKAGADA